MLEHIPVLLDESVEFICSDLVESTILDCTCGAGGHAYAFLKNTNENVKLICIDRDRDALEIAKKNLNGFRGRVELINMKFSEIESLFVERNIKRVFYDLGISTMQIDNFDKGFTYKKEQKLDMRMGHNNINAFNVVNEFSFSKLAEIFHIFGQEKFSNRIAENIVKQREKKAIETTTELSLIIRRSIPRNMQLKTLSRVFQAIRIAVNDELNELENTLRIVLDRLPKDGRIAVITYHSLERNIVRKVTMDRNNVKVKKKNPLKKEIKENRRARSAKLYKIEKI